MVSSPITFNLSKVDYFRDKDPQIDKAKAKAIEQPSHPEMVKSFTDFIDGLIKLEVGRLEKAAGDSSDAEATKNFSKYNEEKGSTTSFRGEVASDLAKNIYAVKQFLIEDGLAEQKDNHELTFKTKDSVDGSKIADESAQELAQEALALVHQKLSSYGINIDTAKATELQQKILEQLKQPPAPKDQATTTEATSATEGAGNTTTAATEVTSTSTTTAENTPPENPNDSIISFFKKKQSKLAKELLGSESVATFISQPADKETGQASGISQLRELNQKIREILAKDWEQNLDKVATALESLNKNLQKNKEFIETHLGKDSFSEAFKKLTDDEKIQVGILLKNLETTVDEKTMVDLTGKITGQLGTKTKENLQTQLDVLINERKSQSTKSNISLGLNLDAVNKHLKAYNEELLGIKKQNLPTQIEVEAKQEATENFLTKIKDDKSLSSEDIIVLKKSIGLTEKERKSGNASPAIDNICRRFIDSMQEKGEELGIKITSEGLKQFAGTAVILAIGAALFCPNLVGNLTKGAFSLGTMITQTVLPLYQNITQANLTRTLAEKTSK
ncbi:MAG: hypothetical protein ACKO3R_10780 [bacterium]